MSANVSSIEKRTRRLRSSSSSIIVQKTSNKLSFRELQRLQARKLETIGFAGWISSTILYGLYFMWAFLSDETLESYGITYYPSKNWAIAIPAMIVMTYLFSLVFYKAINLLSTPSLDSYATLYDVHSVFLPQTQWEDQMDFSTPAIGDLSILDVNQCMVYGKIR